MQVFLKADVRRSIYQFLLFVLLQCLIFYLVTYKNNSWSC